MYTAILFDLDGTLTDSREGILNSVLHALEQEGFETPDRKQIEWVIGPPLRESFAKLANIQITDSSVERLMERYRERFGPIGIFENKLFSEIPSLLKSLYTKNIKCFVATSKPTVYAKKIVTHFKIADYFVEVLGSEMDGSRENKREIIGELIERHKLNAAETLMVGDRAYDVLGAKAHQMDVAGVLYGFGSFEELTDAGATFIANTPLDILEFID